MLRKVANTDLKAIYELGSKYDLKFKNKYNLESYLNNELYIMNLDEEDGIIAGFIICTVIDKRVEILLVYVDQKYRGHKIGTALLKSIESGASEILLEVSKNNDIAFNLYSNNGYQVIATRPKYYNGIDAIVMKKVLK